MKKFGLSFAVIFAFIFYSWHQQKEIAQAPILSLPTQSKNNITVFPAPSTSSPTTIPSAPTIAQSGYKNGIYTGSVADAFYGNIQVQVNISKGKISNIQFLQYPNDRGTSIAINQQADPMLAQEAIQAQSSQVNVVSGATDSSQAFIQSMQSALSQAKS